jgi:hypothetical protein
MAELMRLMIPRGWVVLDNKLYDTEPLTDGKDTFITNAFEGFIEDVLWIQETIINQEGHYDIPAYNHFTIGINWLPDSKIDGQYYAKLHWCGEEEMEEVETLETKDRFQIRDRIEYWMAEIKGWNSAYQKWRTK